MPSYELTDGASNKFWEIELCGSTVLRWWGRLGSTGKFGERAYKSRASAERTVRRLVAQKTAAGYRQVVGDLERELASVKPREERELLAALVDDPDSEAGYLVYADWLSGVGDPRGELMSVQHALEQVRGRSLAGDDGGDYKAVSRRVLDLRRREDALLDRHRAYFLGPLARVAPGPKTSRSPTRRLGRVGMSWHLGFIRELSLPMGAPQVDAADVLRQAFDHPSGRLITRLELQRAGGAASMREAVAARGAALAALADSARPSLRALCIDCWRDAMDVEALLPALRAAPRLTELALRCRVLTLAEPLPLPHIERLEIHTAQLDGLALPALLGHGQLPALRRLSVGRGLEAHSARWLLEAPMRSLTDLELVGLRGAARFVEALMLAPLGAQLERLSLRDCRIDEVAAETIVEARRRLPRLGALDVDPLCSFDGAAEQRLAACGALRSA